VIETIKKDYSGYTIYTPPTQANVGTSETAQKQSHQSKEYTVTNQYINYIDELGGNHTIEAYETFLKEEEISTIGEQGYLFDVLTKEEGEAVIKTSLEAARAIYQHTKSQKSQNEVALENKIQRILQRLDSMYVYAMNKEGKLSINDFYKGSFTGGPKVESENKLPYSKQEVESVLEKNGLEKNEENKNAVDKLLQLGLEVSKKDVVKIQNIEAAITGLETYTGNTYNADEPLMEEEKILYSEKDIRDIIEDLTSVQDETLEEVVHSGNITIGNIRELMHKNTNQILQKANPSSKEISSEETNNSSIKQQVSEVRDYIKGIRAKLNVEAARKISEKMPLESSQLTKVANELEKMQTEQVEHAMEQVGLDPTEENKEIINDVMEAVHYMTRYKLETVEVQIESQQNISIEECTSALKAYEEHFSVPEARFKEGIHKVEAQIESFLENSGLEPEKEMIEAAKALIANEIELNKENLQIALEVVQKLNTFLEETTPHFMARLIKDGFNPYKMSIEEILDVGTKERLPAIKEGVARAILSLEEKGKINEIQKQELIGLYRIIGKVEQSKDEISGYLIKNNLPLTMQKLDEASKYIHKKEVINQKVDHTVGEVKELTYEKETARQMIEKGQAYNERLSEIARALEAMELPVDPANINKVGKLNAILYAFLKENIKKELGKFEGIDLLPSHLKEKIEVAKNASPELIERMKEKNIPITIDHLYWLQKSSEDKDVLKQQMTFNQLEEEEKNPAKSLEEFKEKRQEEEKRAREEKVIAVEDGNMERYRNYRQIEEIFKVNKSLQDKEGIYQIPFIIEGEQKLVQLYVHQNNAKKKDVEEGLQIVISYDTKNMGTVMAKVKLKEEELSYIVKAQTRGATNLLGLANEALEKDLDAIGYKVIGKAYSEEKIPQQIHPVTIKHIESSFEKTI
jgi:hypothetical protein